MSEPEVNLADLADEDWIALPEASSTARASLFESACRASGFTPRIRYRLDEVSAVTQVLASTNALILAQPTCRRNPGVVARPLTGEPILFRISFVWRASPTEPSSSPASWAHTDPAWLHATSSS